MSRRGRIRLTSPGAQRRRGRSAGDCDVGDVLPVGGADVELGNFISGSLPIGRSTESMQKTAGMGTARWGTFDRDARHTTCHQAAEAILAEIDGVSDAPRPQWSTAYDDPQDRGRRYLATNGGCAYIDLGHTEVCVPEVTSARDFVTYWHAMLRIVRRAQQRANLFLAPRERVEVIVNNSDGAGHSYGAHLNYLVPRRLFDDLFAHRFQHALWLASYHASSIVVAGGGKVGSENGRPPVEYQLSQRADFFERLAGPQTTFDRPILNLRDEPLCGRAFGPRDTGSTLARLHVIFYDANLCHVANYLKFGVMQLVLSLLDAGEIDLGILFEDPLDAVRRFSHDPDLGARARTLGGERVGAVDHQRRIADCVERLCARGRCHVPEAERVLALWRNVLDDLAARRWDALAPRLDWVLKRSIIAGAIADRGDLDWSSPEARHLDLLYGSLDAESGLYWALEREGLVERLTDENEIERASREPPEETRAWTRAMLLRAASRAQIDTVDWDMIRFRGAPDAALDEWRTVPLPDPRRGSRRETERIFTNARTFEDVLDALSVRT